MLLLKQKCRYCNDLTHPCEEIKLPKWGWTALSIINILLYPFLAIENYLIKMSEVSMKLNRLSKEIQTKKNELLQESEKK